MHYLESSMGGVVLLSVKKKAPTNGIVLFTHVHYKHVRYSNIEHGVKKGEIFCICGGF